MCMLVKVIGFIPFWQSVPEGSVAVIVVEFPIEPLNFQENGKYNSTF